MKNIRLIALLIISFTLIIFSCVNSTDKNKLTEETDKKNNPSELSEIIYETYCNDRFGFCIDYPSKALLPKGESANGDGQIFSSEDEQNTLWVYRDYRDNINPSNQFDITIAYNEDIENQSKRITYKHIGEKYYVISGYNDGKIFYQKTILTKDGLATALIEYTKSEKEFYDKVAEQIFKTFKWHEHGWIET